MDTQRISELMKGPLGLALLFGLLVLAGGGVILYALSVLRGFDERIQGPI